MAFWHVISTSVSSITQLQTIAIRRQIWRLITIQILDLSYFSIVCLVEYQRDSVHDHPYTLIFGGSIVTVKSSKEKFLVTVKIFCYCQNFYLLSKAQKQKFLLSKVVTGKSPHFEQPNVAQKTSQFGKMKVRKSAAKLRKEVTLDGAITNNVDR